MYAGKHLVRFEDATGKVQSGVAAPKIDWESPQFDPSKPGTFEGYLAKHRQWMLRLFQQQFGQAVKLGR
jgi:hypothetical protein